MSVTQRSAPGHVFVVHGRLQDVTCDAIVIPTDTSFTVEPHWDDVVGVPGHDRPAGWAEKHFGLTSPVKGERQLFWYLDVTDDDRAHTPEPDERNSLVHGLTKRPVLRMRGVVAAPLVAHQTVHTEVVLVRPFRAGGTKRRPDGQSRRELTRLPDPPLRIHETEALTAPGELIDLLRREGVQTVIGPSR